MWIICWQTIHMKCPNLFFIKIIQSGYRGFYMSAHLLLNILKNLRKRDKMWGSSEHFIVFCYRWNKSTNMSLFALVLYIPVKKNSIMSGGFPVFLGWTSSKLLIKFLAQGHSTVTPLGVSLELAKMAQKNLWNMFLAWKWSKFCHVIAMF